MNRPLPPLAILVTHRVAAYDAWKTAFDAHRGARKAASFLGDHLNRNGDEVAVYLPATDRARVAAFVDSSELRSTMQQASVTSPPRIEWLKPVEDAHIADRSTAGMIVAHAVKDYAAWKKAYDSVEALRKRHGVIGAAVNQALDDPNLVTVYHQAETRAELQAFASSPELKTAMQQAGVTGAPEFRYYDALLSTVH
jgi:quinol monooxygenase YgiN